LSESCGFFAKKNAACKHDRHQDIINDAILCGRMAYQSNHGERTNHNSDNLVRDWCHKFMRVEPSTKKPPPTRGVNRPALRDGTDNANGG
jgi:hypothetical protein